MKSDDALLGPPHSMLCKYTFRITPLFSSTCRFTTAVSQLVVLHAYFSCCPCIFLSAISSNMAATSYDRDAAVKVAEENYSLRKRLARMEWEEEKQRRAAEYESRFEGAVDTSANDRMRSRNSALQDEIAGLESQLKELQMINVTDLQHEYTRLDNRRAYLLNEIAGLRRILANQSKEVKRATRSVNSQHELRRQNNEQHAASIEDIQMFRKKRESLAEETQHLIAKERQLMSELETLPAPGEDQEVMASRLREDNEKKDHTIAQLEATLKEKQLKAGTQLAEANSAVDIQHLREEYVRLNDQLRRIKQ
ncbi:conserved hypothetical protein [Leishmania infantum JPCM5]|uniref:Uncharacterized protein n=2 Tax=Leishmania infantum TaxID=5671 RepID=A4ICS9_LEIIN|nr:conserved hypothetical protein [Leishmania infantum JPCM5]CAM72657.1 conserved hypothetical protein [Leishmania infantum JPCM5]|eukprot:XP_001469548.1 conserved hypothetical protein [Leishmania infantum JPCM5]